VSRTFSLFGRSPVKVNGCLEETREDEGKSSVGFDPVLALVFKNPFPSLSVSDNPAPSRKAVNKAVNR